MPSVLIVDDAAYIRTTVSQLFLEWGFDVVGEATNGKEAVEFYHLYRPDLVTMDVTMPIMSGIDASREILHNYPDAKIIMMTALGQQRLIVEALKIGVKDFITKPFDSARLKMIVRKVLDTYE